MFLGFLLCFRSFLLGYVSRSSRYHHALTGYYALVCFHEKNAHLIYVVWANYLIHFFMYGYYMLRSLKVKVPPQVAQLITTGQMVQVRLNNPFLAIFSPDKVVNLKLQLF